MFWTPLHHACNTGNQEVFNLLLAYGGEFYERDDYMGWTPLTLLEQAMDVVRLEGVTLGKVKMGRVR